MQKFKQQPNRSRFDKYILNAPFKAGQKGGKEQSGGRELSSGGAAGGAAGVVDSSVLQ